LRFLDICRDWRRFISVFLPIIRYKQFKYIVGMSTEVFLIFGTKKERVLNVVVILPVIILVRIWRTSSIRDLPGTLPHIQLLKGQSSQPIFWVEHKNSFVITHKTFIRYSRNNRFWLHIRRDIRIWKSTPRHHLLRRVETPRIVYYGESKLLELFTMQSHDPPHHLLLGVVNNISFLGKSIIDLRKFVECTVFFIS